MKKSIAPRIWKSWKIVSEATATRSQIRKDPAGHKWEYCYHIQNFYVKEAK